MFNLQRKGGPVGGVPAASSMPKSVSFVEKNRDQWLIVMSLRTFLRWNCLAFIMGDRDDFSC